MSFHYNHTKFWKDSLINKEIIPISKKVHVFLRHPVGVKNYQNEKKVCAELGHSDLLLVLILPKCLYLKKY